MGGEELQFPSEEDSTRSLFEWDSKILVLLGRCKVFGLGWTLQSIYDTGLGETA